MSSVFVRSSEAEDRLQISIDLKIPSKCGTSSVLKSFSLNRLKTEELKVAVDRLRLNLSKKIDRKAKQKKKSEQEATNEPMQFDNSEISIEIINGGSAVDLTVTNEQAWVDGAVLKIGEEEISICYNPPRVKLEKLSSIIMAGFPLYPEVELEFTDENHSEFYWKSFPEKYLHKFKMAAARGALDLSDAIKTYAFTPAASDVGNYILMACVPRNGNKLGKTEIVFSTTTVTAGPGPCPFEKRSEFTKEFSAEKEFRVLSYNLLAQCYGDTEVARNELFSYCPSYALDMDYRKHLLLKEILGYKADLLCLQEVDRFIFTSQLMPAMKALGYTGLFRAKDSNVSEGCASFFRDSKFCVRNELDIVLSSFLASDPICADIWSAVCKVGQLKEKLEQRSTILQVTVVESKEIPGNYVCLANTHLYFHPTACNIRLIHAATAMRYLQNICDTYKSEGKKISLVFCGDFNSSPDVGIYQLMTAQFIPSDYADWNSAGEDELITGLELHQTMNIESACGVPPYTNYTQGFQNTLDYIFIDSDNLQVSKVVPLPSHEDVTANIALPSALFPSDHLALICDLKFKL